MSIFEQSLQNAMSNSNKEKTYVDKLLAKNEVERVKELVKKEKLDRGELLELLYMCLSTEAKLVNLGSWDRYVVLKFFVWIREFIKVAELMYDYQDKLEEKEKEGKFELPERTKEILEHNQKLIEHNAKFLIDLYLNILRTTLSLGGSGFMELLKNKFEVDYNQKGQVVTREEKQKSFMGFKY